MAPYLQPSVKDWSSRFGDVAYILVEYNIHLIGMRPFSHIEQ